MNKNFFKDSHDDHDDHDGRDETSKMSTAFRHGKTFYDKALIKQAILHSLESNNLRAAATDFKLPYETLKYWKLKYNQFGGRVFEDEDNQPLQQSYQGGGTKTTPPIISRLRALDKRMTNVS